VFRVFEVIIGLFLVSSKVFWRFEIRFFWDLKHGVLKGFWGFELRLLGVVEIG